LNIRVAADFCIGRNSSIANPHQMFPLRQSPLKPMLSATRKLAMTHRSISRWISVVSLFGEEGLAWPCPRNVEQPRRDAAKAVNPNWLRGLEQNDG
jgi:hypothetical protein